MDYMEKYKTYCHNILYNDNEVMEIQLSPFGVDAINRSHIHTDNLIKERGGKGLDFPLETYPCTKREQIWVFFDTYYSYKEKNELMFENIKLISNDKIKHLTFDKETYDKLLSLLDGEAKELFIKNTNT